MFPFAPVDMQPFAIRDITGAVIALQLDKRLAVVVTKTLTERLDHRFFPVGHFNKRPEIEIDALIRTEHCP
ncbi:hypothetical protein D3C72_2520640 [compost metagenome]